MVNVGPWFQGSWHNQRERNVVRAKSHVFMLSVHALSSLVRLVTSLIGTNIWSCESSPKNWWFSERLAITSERCSIYDEENGLQY